MIKPVTAERPSLSVVVPVYRSEETVHELATQILDAFSGTSVDLEVVLVDDGSPDGSWRVIESLARENLNVRGIRLRRNFGQDNAILAGLRVARGEYCAVMDDDLQHDPYDLPRLLADIEKGADVTYGHYRTKRQRWWKNFGSWFNGKTAEWVLGKPPEIYLSPFKVMRREIAEAICEYTGRLPYVDGLLLQVTSNYSQVEVVHHPRRIGVSTYRFFTSLGVWLRLACQFSMGSMRLIQAAGGVLAVLGMVSVVAVLVSLQVRPGAFQDAQGWAVLMALALFLGGVQVAFLGVIGEYFGGVSLNINRRPQALIRTTLNLGNKLAPQALDGASRGVFGKSRTL